MSLAGVIKKFYVNNVLTDAISATFGVTRNDTLGTVVSAGTALTHNGTGLYSGSWTEPTAGLVYTVTSIFTYGGETFTYVETVSTPADTTGLLEDTASLIDYMMLKYGPISTDELGRSDCLKWLNRANTELLVLYPWWFLRDSTSLAFTDNTSSYTLPDDTEDVYELVNADGTPIQKIPHRSAQWMYKSSSALKGAVRAWWVESRDNDSGSGTYQRIVLRVWPPALGSTSATMFRRIKPGELTDSATNYSKFPEGHRTVILYRGLELMAKQQGKPALASEYKADADRLLQALITADVEHQKGLT